jgi:hypothetical protein
MLVLALINWAEALPVIIGLLGIAGLIFTALKYNRDDSTAVLNQQSIIVGEMKTLNDELRTTTTRLREERDGLQAQVAELTKQVEALQAELRR